MKYVAILPRSVRELYCQTTYTSTTRLEIRGLLPVMLNVMGQG